jgi:hypothetical protein
MSSFDQQYFNPYYIPQVSTRTAYSSIEGFQPVVNPATPVVPSAVVAPSSQAVVAPSTGARAIPATQVVRPVNPVAQMASQQVASQQLAAQQLANQKAIAQKAQTAQQKAVQQAMTAQTAQQKAAQQAMTAQNSARNSGQRAQNAQIAQQNAQTAQQKAQTAQQKAQTAQQTAAQQAETAQNAAQIAQNSAQKAQSAAQIAQNNRYYHRGRSVPRSDRWDRHLPSRRGPYWQRPYATSSLYYDQPRTIYVPTPTVATLPVTDLSYCNQFEPCGGLNADPLSCTKCVADRLGTPACANYVCNNCSSHQKCAVWKGNPYYSCRRCMGEQNANPACADQICGPDPNA